jgi:LmbE family N-acetylglucosaminyl deacetylase
MILPKAKRVLVIAPHPDDEAIAAWNLICTLSRQGSRIDVLVVSDGGASHPGSARWPATRLIAERRRETIRAMRFAGLAPASVRFLDLDDGCLELDPTMVRRAMIRAMCRLPAPDLIVSPERTDVHADHRTVSQALAAIRRRGEQRLTYHVWPVHAARGARRYGSVLKGAALAIKRRIIRSYRTQGGIIGDAPTGFTLTHRHLRAFAAPTERFAGGA